MSSTPLRSPARLLRSRRAASTALGACMLLGIGCSDGSQASAVGGAPPGFESFTSAGPGRTLSWLLRRPNDESGPPRPLYLALHGCSQTADQFAEIAHLADLADTHGAYVVAPEQDPAANALRCWNWFDPSSHQRTGGEPEILAGIVQQAMTLGSVDPNAVHVFGLSAGGAMSVVLASTWPDLFASAGSVAGCPFRGTPCLSSPSGASTDELAQFVTQAMGANARLVPLIVMQGDADTTVPPENAEVLVRQWIAASDRIDDGVSNGSVASVPSSASSGAAPGGHDYDVATYTTGEGQSLVERWLIHGAGHAWPGGAANRLWSDSLGPDATSAIAMFLDGHEMP